MYCSFLCLIMFIYIAHCNNLSYNVGWVVFVPTGIMQGCQHWMRVQSETCDGRPLPAYKVAQVPKKFFDLKIFASICRHIVEAPFVHH